MITTVFKYCVGFFVVFHVSTTLPAAEPTVVSTVNAYVHFFERAALAFQRGGPVVDVPFGLGDTVEQGELVARLDDRVARATLDVAEARAESDAGVRRAIVQRSLARQELDNAKLANQRVALTYPESEVKRRRAKMEAAALDVELARRDHRIDELERDRAKAELSTYELVAPFDAVVAEVHVTKGNTTRTGDPVIELVNTAVLRVNAYVAYSDAWRIRPGDRVTIRVEDPEVAPQLANVELKGVLQAVSTSAETVRRLVGVTAIVDNLGGRLKDGMEVSMTIEPGAADSAGAVATQRSE